MRKTTNLFIWNVNYKSIYVGSDAGVSAPLPWNSKLPCARLKSVNVPFHDFTMAVPCSALTFDSAVPLSSTGWKSRVTL